MHALTAEQLMAEGTAEDFAQARRRLRQRARGTAHSADEHELTQHRGGSVVGGAM